MSADPRCGVCNNEFLESLKQHLRQQLPTWNYASALYSFQITFTSNVWRKKPFRYFKAGERYYFEIVLPLDIVVVDLKEGRQKEAARNIVLNVTEILTAYPAREFENKMFIGDLADCINDFSER